MFKTVVALSSLALCYHGNVVGADLLPALDIESLMSMDVQATSAMKRAETAFNTPASIYVLTNERIAHSGAQSVPEALKMVPGLVVRQLDNNQWAITSRGVASRFSSKMLVLIDGQNLYTPKFSAVYWETLNVPLYDIERIEVIRGQGGLLWGSNATNGVINIITKNSFDTRGIYADMATGSLTNYQTNFRYGGDIGSKASYRVYGQLRDGEPSSTALDLPPVDNIEQTSFGARFDVNINDSWSGFIQTDHTRSDYGQNYRGVIDETNLNTPLSGQFNRKDIRVMGRIENRISSQANQMLQLSWLEQTGSHIYLEEEFTSIDADYQLNFLYQDLRFDLGLIYRAIDVNFNDSPFIFSDTRLNTLHQYGGFVQAQYSIIPEQLKLIAGIRSEHNELTEWEHQPLVRMLWHPSPRHTYWASVSRSSRIPALIEYNDNYVINGTKVKSILPTETGIEFIDNYAVRTILNGNNQVDSEKSTSYELGYRYSDHKWQLDLSLYRTQSTDATVLTIEPDVHLFDSFFNHLNQGQLANALDALRSTSISLDMVSNAELNTYGGDIGVSWQVSDNFNTELGYSYNHFEYDLQANTFPAIGRNSTSKQTFFKADWRYVAGQNLFAVLRHEQSNAYNTDNYTALDVTWNWAISDYITFSLIGKNLIANTHLEFENTNETYTIPNYIDESITGKLAVDF
ncbi:TonB-dependent receptor plug domain-containing protein [Shewanella maritima]|nr:TonB-dependent receptor [Shewanella maritima]